MATTHTHTHTQTTTHTPKLTHTHSHAHTLPHTHSCSRCKAKWKWFSQLACLPSTFNELLPPSTLLSLTWAWHLPLALVLLLFYLVPAAVGVTVNHIHPAHTHPAHTHMFIVCNFHLFICILVAPQNLQQLVASFVAVEGEREGRTYMVFPRIKRKIDAVECLSWASWKMKMNIYYYRREMRDEVDLRDD